MITSHCIWNSRNFNSCGHINQCSGGTSVEDVARVQAVHHLENKTVVYVDSGCQAVKADAKHYYHQWLPLQAELGSHLLTTVRLVELFKAWSTLQEPNPASCSSQTCTHIKTLRTPQPAERHFPMLIFVCRGTARDPLTSHVCNSGFKSPSHFLKGSVYNCCTGYLLVTCCILVDIQTRISVSTRTHKVWLSSNLIIFWIFCCHSPTTFV